MKFLISIVLCLSFAHYSPAQCLDSTNVYTFTYAGKTYEVVKELKNWADAAACAVERGGYLVEINDANEQDSVYHAITAGAKISSTYTTIGNGGGIAYIWIGATDQQAEGTWLWDGDNDKAGINFWNGQGANGTGNGTPINEAYVNWGGSSTNVIEEPDNFGAGQNHGAMALSGWPSGSTFLGVAGEWNDIIGSSQLYFVIEKDNTTNVEDPAIRLGERLILFPNPSQGVVTLDKIYEKTEIYDFAGQLVQQYKNVQSLDLSGLEKGVYIIRANRNNTLALGKVVLR